MDLNRLNTIQSIIIGLAFFAECYSRQNTLDKHFIDKFFARPKNTRQIKNHKNLIFWIRE
jgi:hypothetical protein